MCLSYFILSTEYRLLVSRGSHTLVSKSDLKDKTELDRYKELDNNYRIDPALDVICVIEGWPLLA
jgi:hypothetical protein